MAEGKDEDELEELDIAIGMITDPAEEAVAALRAYQEAMGMAWDATPVPEGSLLWRPTWAR